MTEKKNTFINTMSKTESVCGTILLPVYIVLLPIFITLSVERFVPDITDERLGLLFYLVSFLLILLVFHNYLRSMFSKFTAAGFTAVHSVFAGYIGYYLFSYLLSFLLYMTNSGVNPNDQAVIIQATRNPGIIFAVAVLLGPVVEESLFRGLVFGWLRTKNRITAYLVSYLVFSFYHLWEYFVVGFHPGLLINLLDYLPASIMLCWSYERSGTVWSSILLHMVINLLSVVAITA